MRIGLLLATIFIADIIAADHGPETWRRDSSIRRISNADLARLRAARVWCSTRNCARGSGIIYSVAENSLSNKILTAAHVVRSSH